jgi:hypothetical protein
MRVLTRREASEYLREKHHLRLSPKTLAKLASVGGGPDYAIYGCYAGYTEANLDLYAASRISAPRSSTSEAA